MPSKKPRSATGVTLVIVESPTKAKTISKFLPIDFKVEASFGHIRDLPKSKIGINVKEGFEPTYTIPVKAQEKVKELMREAKRAGTIILAPDPDREGEAIAWHLVHALELGKRTADVQRIAFHEITKEAIDHALKHPREIDMHLVDAQQARRVLDRLVGYELSPFLWRKIRYGLSAGRVQSVAVRLIVEREREIEAFNREEYWSVEAEFKKEKQKATFAARLYSIEGKALPKMAITNEQDAKSVLAELSGAKYRVQEVNVKAVKRTPPPPFITSTLQQEASRKLGYSAKQTMMVAQRLYERGVITYMRTDSVHLAPSALTDARNVIGELYGKDYLPESPRHYKSTSKGAQEAHEAIRPTKFGTVPGGDSVGDRNEERLYALIWKRAIASQMGEALLEQTAADILANTPKRHVFRANGQVVKFDGFIRVYTEGKDDSDEGAEGILPPLEKDEALKLDSIEPVQHFTEPPPRYTDATLVKALESFGVGRPSTYAPTLATIQERGYVEKIEKRYHPVDIGIVVTDLLVEHFPEIVDINFTSHMEEELDTIAEGNMDWQTVCREFYEPFKKHLTAKEEEVEKQVVISDTPCPHCKKPMLIKFGRMGKFLACPEAGVKVTLPMPEEAAAIKALEEKTKDERCPLCGKPMTVKRGRFGFFLGCGDYPTCKGISKIWNKTGFKCPECLAAEDRREKPGDIVEKKTRGRGNKIFYACTCYPDCTFVTNKKPESEEEVTAAHAAWKIAATEPKKEKGKKLARKKAKSS